MLPAFVRAARDWHVWFLPGSLGVRNPDGRFSNRAYVMDSDGESMALTEIDLTKVDKARGKIPALSHDRPTTPATPLDTAAE